MMTHDIFILKLKAFAIHFGISFAIFLILLYFVIFHWYPFPFFTTDGGWQGVRLIAAVDLVLGPTLTFIVFNTKKSRAHLTMDLSLIGLCQVAALIWGMWAVHNERPYLVVFADGIFYPLAYYQIPETGLNKQQLKNLTSTTTPVKIHIDIPTEPTKYMQLLHEAAASKPIHYMGERYQSFDETKLENISRYNIDMTAYLKGEPDAWQKEYQTFVQRQPDKLSDMLFFPLNARYEKHIVVLDKTTLDFVAVLDIPPPDIDEVFRGKEKAKQNRLIQAEKNQLRD